MSLSVGCCRASFYSASDPKRRKERAGTAQFVPPFPFFEWGNLGGYAHGRVRRRGGSDSARGVGPKVPPVSFGRSVGRKGDGGFVAPLGTVVTCRGLPAWTAIGIAGRLQTLGSGAAGGQLDDLERAFDRSGRTDREGGDPGIEPRPARDPRVGGSVDRASVGA